MNEILVITCIFCIFCILNIFAGVEPSLYPGDLSLQQCCFSFQILLNPSARPPEIRWRTANSLLAFFLLRKANSQDLVVVRPPWLAPSTFQLRVDTVWFWRVLLLFFICIKTWSKQSAARLSLRVGAGGIHWTQALLLGQTLRLFTSARIISRWYTSFLSSRSCPGHGHNSIQHACSGCGISWGLVLLKARFR